MPALLKYKSLIKEFTSILVPSKTIIPEWYRSLMPIIDGNENNMSSKKCIPFLESFTTGYSIVLPCDILVKQTDGQTNITWRMEEFNILSSRSELATNGMSIPIGCGSTHFVWQFPTTFEIPSGYSILFTHPLNRNDLPFVTMSGVIDGQYVLSEGGNVPVFFSNVFEGVIPQGTPIAQIIPFKTEDWKSEEDNSLIEKSIQNRKKSNLLMSGWYKKNYWKRKSYE
jgi:hypothetical protein